MPGGEREAGGCPSEATIFAFVEGTLPATERATVEGHLASCDECRMLVSALARGSPEAPAVKAREPSLATTDLAAPSSGRAAPLGPVRPGDVLAGKYVVERVIGIGGMGVVVAAQHRELAQLVALKFLLPAAFEAPGARARFIREARSAARIQSEHVARVMDVGTLENGAPYLVMEHLVGVDLGARLKDGAPLSPELAIDLVLQACEAIAEAHSLGIVHRDLKPANLFLAKRPDGTPILKVLDFGISKADGGSQGTLTTQSSMMGSPRYMSPEQLRSARDVDARTDVWSLGVLLFELTSGVPPFRGESVVNVCAAIATDTPPRLRTLVPSAPEALEKAIEGCLQKDPEARLASVAALARALAPVASPRALASIERIVRIGGESSEEAAPIRPSARWSYRVEQARSSRKGALIAVTLAACVAGAGILAAKSTMNDAALAAATPTATSNIPVRSPDPGRSTGMSTGSEGTLVNSTATPTSTATSTSTSTATPTSALEAPPPVPSGGAPLAMRVKRKDPEPRPPVVAAVDAGAATPVVGQSGLLERK